MNKNKTKNKTKKEIGKIIITISNNDDCDELFDILVNDGSLPFKTPAHLMFPKGKKEFARRAKMLMLAGVDFFKEKYPILNENTIKNTNIEIQNKIKESESLVVF